MSTFEDQEDASRPFVGTETELNALLGALPSAQQYGFRLHSIRPGRCTLHVPYQPALDRPGGIVAGYVFMAAADVAMWLAILTKIGDKEMAVTAEMKTAFLRSARGEDFRCRATVLKCGKRLIYGVAACLSARGVLTHHTLTYLRSSV
jgi:uncharacterized protein (TIGR00369 family)